MEYFDTLTAEGRPDGRRKARQLVHKDGDWHGASRIWLVRRVADTDGKKRTEVLLQRRSEEKDSYPGLWDVSAAGHVAAGGNYLETAVRETAEELGISLEPDELTFLFSLKSESTWEYRGEIFTDREFHHVFMAEKDVDIEEVRLQKEEVAEVCWMDAEKLYDALKDKTLASCIHMEEYEKLFDIWKQWK